MSRRRRTSSKIRPKSPTAHRMETIWTRRAIGYTNARSDRKVRAAAGRPGARRIAAVIPASPPAADEDVCAVVVTFNRRELLRECLLALREQTRRPQRVIVVDNASTDGTPELVRAEFPEVEL